MVSVQVADNVHVVIGGEFPTCNSLVILNEEIVIVDPGCPLEKLRLFLQKHDSLLQDIDLVILSHIHPDHIIHTMKLKRLSRCRIAANERTAPLFNDKEEMKKFLGFPKGHPVRHLWEDLVNNRMYGALDDGHIDMTLTNGEKYSTGNTTLKMLYTPGHLPDHMCIEILEPNYVFGADIDCTPFGPFYGHPNCSILKFKESIHNLKNNEYSGLISGHLQNPLIHDYQGALDEYESHFTEREEKIMTAIQNKSNTLEKINQIPIMYPSLINPVYMQFEKWMIELHLKLLKKKGLIEEQAGKLIVKNDFTLR